MNNLVSPVRYLRYALPVWLLLFCVTPWAGADETKPPVGPNKLQDVSFSELRDNMTLFKAFFALPLEKEPSVLTEADPPVINFVFHNALFEGAKLLTHANTGSLRSVKVEQGEDNIVRVTLYLKEPAQHTIRLERDQFIVVLNTAKQTDVVDQPRKVVEALKTAKRSASGPNMAPLGEEIIDLDQISGSVIYMYKGDLQVFNAQDVTQVALGDASVVSASIRENGELLLIGEKAGVTMMRLWRGDGTERNLEVHVAEKNAQTTISNAAALLAGLDGVRIRYLGNLVVVEGNLNPRVKAQVEKIAKALPELVDLTSEAEVPMLHMVHMAVKLVEFSTNALENMGIKWDSQIEGPQGMLMGDFVTNPWTKPSLPAAVAVPNAAALPWRVDPMIGYLGLATSIASKINLAVVNGEAYVVASPTLSTRSGGEANFLSGGEVPLPSTSTTGSGDVKFKEYGIKLTVKPVADDKGNIRSTINTEISTIDSSVTVNGIPGFLTRKTEAEINVKNGETMVLSGLESKQTGRNNSRVPLLGNIPFIGWLFKSEEWTAKKTELVIFVTPNVVDTDSDMIKSSLRRGEEIKEGFDKMFSNGIVD